MKIYIMMCLGDQIGDTYYTNEEEVKRLVDEANEIAGGDIWYKELKPFKVTPPIKPNPDMKPTTVDLKNLSSRLKVRRDEMFRGHR